MRMRADRRGARETAMRALFQMDLSGCGPEWALESVMEHSPDLELEGAASEYARSLVMGTSFNIGGIDRVIEGLTHDWAVSRMSPTDRNIMRVAVYEIMHTHDVPMAAAIDEAVEIAKIYGSAESPRFVNGILGALAEQIRAQKDADKKDRDAHANVGDSDGSPIGDEE